MPTETVRLYTESIEPLPEKRVEENEATLRTLMGKDVVIKQIHCNETSKGKLISEKTGGKYTGKIFYGVHRKNKPTLLFGSGVVRSITKNKIIIE